MKHRAQQFLVFAFVLMTNLIGAHPCAAAVALHGDINISKAVVKLSDVFDGLPDGVDCDIARAPAPGKSIVYDVHVLTHLAQQYKLDWQPQGKSDHITVTTMGTRLTEDDLRTGVAEKIKDLGIKGDIDVAFDNHALEIDLPGDHPPNFMLSNFSYDSISKRFHANLVADGFTGLIDLLLSGHVTVRRSVPVLTKRLAAGTLIGAVDIDWVSLPEDRLGGVVLEAEQLINHELRRDMDGEQPLHDHDVMPPRLVVRGTLVTMKIETSMLIITTQGRALQDGKLGDIVRVTNTQSNRTIEGAVEGSGLVRIPLGQKLAAADSRAAQE